MVWTSENDRQVEQRLRDLIDEGQLIEQAIRTIHQGEGVGTLFICPAVERVAGLPSTEAKRLVVRALLPI
jgi:hypothetical protein